jgi:hypothetical protein
MPQLRQPIRYRRVSLDPGRRLPGREADALEALGLRGWNNHRYFAPITQVVFPLQNINHV